MAEQEVMGTRDVEAGRIDKGIRVLEVAQYTFVPSAGAVLADWGADVIKIEHPVKGDGQRGLLQVGGKDNTRTTIACRSGSGAAPTERGSRAARSNS